MGAAVCHCSVSSVFSEVPPKPALLIEQWHTENPASAVNIGAWVPLANLFARVQPPSITGQLR